MNHSTTAKLLFTGIFLASMVMGVEHPRACKAVEQLIETAGCQLTECRLGGLSTVLLGSEEGVRFETRGDLMLLDHECDARVTIPGLFTIQRQKLQELGFAVEGPAQVQEKFGSIVFQKGGHWLELTALMLEGAPSVSLRSVRTEKTASVRRLEPEKAEAMPAAALPGAPAASVPVDAGADQNRLAKVVEKTEAAYPAGFDPASLNGTPILVEVALDEKGGIARILSTKGNPALLTAALQAIRSWTFEPALASGKPVAGVLELAVDFKTRR